MVTPREHAEIEKRLWRKGADADTPVSLIGRGYGGFWLRLVALLIDGVIINVVIFSVMYYKLRIDHPRVRIDGMEYNANFAIAVVNWLYCTLLESSAWQATIGKRLMSLEVTDKDGLRISFLRANGRHFAKILSVMTFFIGFMMAGWTRKKQALHDMVAGTLVVKS